MDEGIETERQKHNYKAEAIENCLFVEEPLITFIRVGINETKVSCQECLLL